MALEHDKAYSQHLATFRAAFFSMTTNNKGRATITLSVDSTDYEAALELSKHPARMFEIIACRKPALSVVHDEEESG